MDSVNQELLDYISSQVRERVSPESIKSLLLINDWPEGVITEAFSTLGVVIDTNLSKIPPPTVTEGEFVSEGITMDKIIEKFIPITGAIFLIVGLGYLIYANAWVNLLMETRIGLGFFFSVVIIGGSFSFSEKMRYFADIGIGSGVLLLYATLIYGSRTTELATAMIPEVVTLVTAVLFTLAVSYFASKRNSKVILILGMIGAYITPFVIGQNDVWVDSVSFNAYLIYFFAINLSVFLIGREISVRDIIPLNIIGLFLGVSTLWGLSSSNNINAIQTGDLFTSELFTAVLFLVLVVFSIWSILLSAKRFSEKDDGYLSLGYIAPIIWFAFNVNNLQSIDDAAVGIMYVVISAACFVGWHVLLGTKTRFQHTALYAAALLSAFLAFFALFKEFDVYTSMFIAYASLIFGFLYMLDANKSERFISYTVVSLAGSLLSLQHILEADLRFETLFIVLALVPAMCAYLIAKNSGKQEFVPVGKIYSIVASIIALMYVLADLIEYIDIDFLLFYLAPLAFLGYLAYIGKVSPGEMSHDSRSSLLRVGLAVFTFGFITVFFTLISAIYPAPTDTFLFTHTDAPVDWIMIKGVFASVILFLGLFISRNLQTEQVIKRPSFILVIFGFTTLLLAGNYIISALANDLGVSLEHGGPRAIATTFWWAAIAIYMLYKGLKLGKKYHSEKLLGLMLLGITVLKIVLYDIKTMDMQNKIIVLMIVGGAMLLFSYQVRSKDLLTTPEVR
ncbi:MAG: hypothetical protein RLZZ230_168 [Candidatus Parcubacteria bacterium]|jgi:hypothetical protein